MSKICRYCWDDATVRVFWNDKPTHDDYCDRCWSWGKNDYADKVVTVLRFDALFADESLIAITPFADRLNVNADTDTDSEEYVRSLCDADDPYVRDRDEVFISFGGRLTTWEVSQQYNDAIEATDYMSSGIHYAADH